MNSNTNITDKALAEKLSLSRMASPSPGFKAGVMMAVARKERRRSTLRIIRNVALGVVAALFALALVGGAMVLAMKFLGLEALVQQMDSYVDDMLATLLALARSTTFGLISLVTIVLGAVMIITQWQQSRLSIKESQRR